jgi:hypothetical protein
MIVNDQQSTPRRALLPSGYACTPNTDRDGSDDLDPVHLCLFIKLDQFIDPAR